MGTVYIVSGFTTGTECQAVGTYPLSTYTRTQSTETIDPITYPSTTDPATTLTFTGYTSTHQAVTTTVPQSSVGFYNYIHEQGGNAIFQSLTLRQPYYYLPGLNSSDGWMHNGTLQNFRPPPDMIAWLRQQPEVVQQFTRIDQCSAGGGDGAPTLHIPVNELTVSSSNTIRVGGYYPPGGAQWRWRIWEWW